MGGHLAESQSYKEGQQLGTPFAIASVLLGGYGLARGGYALYRGLRAADAGSAMARAVGGGAPEAQDVIRETLSGSGNFTSQFTLRSAEALQAGQNFLGAGYRELGNAGSGVFRSAGGLRQFRMDPRSLQGLHPPGVPHVHFELFNLGDILPYVNNHVPIID